MLLAGMLDHVKYTLQTTELEGNRILYKDIKED